jgi:hypothetical protein
MSLLTLTLNRTNLEISRVSCFQIVAFWVDIVLLTRIVTFRRNMLFTSSLHHDLIYRRCDNLSYENILVQTDVFIESVKGPKSSPDRHFGPPTAPSTFYTSGSPKFWFAEHLNTILFSREELGMLIGRDISWTRINISSRKCLIISWSLHMNDGDDDDDDYAVFTKGHLAAS